MDELKTNARELLERAKPQFAPTDEQLARVRRRLSSTPVPPDDGGSGGPPPAATKAANRAWYAGALVVAGVLAAGWALMDSGSGRDVVGAVESPAGRPADEHRAVRIPKTEPSEGLTRRGATATTSAATDLSADADVTAATGVPSEAAPSPVVAPTPSVKPKTSKRAPEPKPPAPVVADTFAAELELIAAARKALEARAFPKAKTTAERYLRRFEEGSFREEAEVLRLLASCGIERTEDVESRARAYVDRSRSAFARRVRIACLDEPR